MDEFDVLQAVDIEQQEEMEPWIPPDTALPSTCIMEHCRGRVSRKFVFDHHTVCVQCRSNDGLDCTKHTCAECCNWNDEQRKQYSAHMRSLELKRESKKRRKEEKARESSSSECSSKLGGSGSSKVKESKDVKGKVKTSKKVSQESSSGIETQALESKLASMEANISLVQSNMQAQLEATCQSLLSRMSDMISSSIPPRPIPASGSLPNQGAHQVVHSSPVEQPERGHSRASSMGEKSEGNSPPRGISRKGTTPCSV